MFYGLNFGSEFFRKVEMLFIVISYCGGIIGDYFQIIEYAS